MTVKDVIQIGKRSVGVGRPVFIIAEAGVNHNGSLKRALELVDAAAEAGTDAVKFQTFSADRLVTHLSPKARYQRETTDPKESQYAMLKKLELSPEAHRELKLRAEKCGLVFLSTPFDKDSADLLEKLGVAAFKIGSGELTDLPLLSHIARKGKPVILSTGMSTMEEVRQAVQTLQKEGLQEIALLHCVSAYPAPKEDVNLLAMSTLRDEFRMPVGYSDHTEGIHVAVLAVACGADIIEKHLTLDKKLPGPDHRISLEPDELAAMVQDVRNAKKILGNGNKQVMLSEANTKSVARKSVVALEVLKRGCSIKSQMVGIRRPGLGIPPSEIEKVIGRTVRRDLTTDIPEGNILTWEMLE